MAAGGSTRLMSKTQRSSGVRESLEMIARTSCVMDPVRSHSVQLHSALLDARGVTGHSRFTCLRILTLMPRDQLRSCVVREGIDTLVEVVLKREILGNEHSLPVFLHHVEVISGVHPALEEDAVHNHMGPSAEALVGYVQPACARTCWQRT